MAVSLSFPDAMGRNREKRPETIKATAEGNLYFKVIPEFSDLGSPQGPFPIRGIHDSI